MKTQSQYELTRSLEVIQTNNFKPLQRHENDLPASILNSVLVILQHNNARRHVAKVVMEYLGTLNWKALSHPQCSIDITLFYYHLLQSMAYVVAEQHYRFVNK